MRIEAKYNGLLGKRFNNFESNGVVVMINKFLKKKLKKNKELISSG